MHLRSWKKLVLVLGLFSAMGMAGAQTGKPLRVGLIGPFTGPSADFGVPMLNGARLAVDEINAAGGFMGRLLELVVKDDSL
jgi:branched-chain amino acid transport system substrate-binding protein